MNISDDELLTRVTEIPSSNLPEYPLPPEVRAIVDGLHKENVRHTVFEVADGEGEYFGLMVVSHVGYAPSLAELRAAYMKWRRDKRKGEA